MREPRVDDTGIPRQPYCCVCGGTTRIESHHVIPRSRGGHKGPQLPLCKPCHTGHHSQSPLTFLFEDDTWYVLEPRPLHVAPPWEAE